MQADTASVNTNHKGHNWGDGVHRHGTHTGTKQRLLPVVDALTCCYARKLSAPSPLPDPAAAHALPPLLNRPARAQTLRTAQEYSTGVLGQTGILAYATDPGAHEVLS